MQTTQENHLYEYAVIRYLPRVERDEFINIGLIMMCKRQRWIKVHLSVDEARLTAFRSPFSKEEVMRQANFFKVVADGTTESGTMKDLPVEERFRWLTAVKSSCLQTSRPHPGITNDLDNKFTTLFEEYVL